VFIIGTTKDKCAADIHKHAEGLPMTGDNYPDDWRIRREKVLDRDGYECIGCGMSDRECKEENDCGLHAHHIVPLSENGGNGLDNLISLCPDCHLATHSERQEAPYNAPEWWDCNYCGEEYMSYNGHCHGYCSGICFLNKNAEGVMNMVNSDETICSTCFNSITGQTKTCDSCGNWEPNVERRDELNVTKINIMKLLRMSAAMHTAYDKDDT